MAESRAVNKPFSQSSEENQLVILEQLSTLFAAVNNVLEIGSGTGQHAVCFARQLAHLKWQPTELKENIAGIEQWLQDAALNNIKKPIALDVMQPNWPSLEQYDAVFTANTLHIMSIKHVEALFSALGRWLPEGSLFCCYGPFNKHGQYSSESNARFDNWLKQRDARSGIRDMDELITLATASGIRLIDDIAMPVNNRILLWKKQ